MLTQPSSYQPPSPEPHADPHILHGTQAFRHTSLALFAAGFATFSMIYCVQPLMPVFTQKYGVSAASSALSLSLTTGVLAFALLFAGNWSDRLGRKPIMVGSLFLSASLVLATSFAPTWSVFLTERALLGLAISGLPAVAMTYLNEEMHADSIGLGMGLYISGSAVGGMSGRLIAGVLANYWGWHLAMAVIAMIGLMAGVIFMRSLPASRHFTPRRLAWRQKQELVKEIFKDLGLPWLFAEGFFLMGILVAFYNYLGYRLMGRPYDFSQAQVGLIFSVYVMGVFSSSWMGHVAGRLGRRKVLWLAFGLITVGVALSFAKPVWVILLSVLLLTIGFFGGHSIASSWVGRRTRVAKAQAASLYLFFYYVGSALVGTGGGFLYTAWGWNGVAGLLLLFAFCGLVIALKLRRLVPMAMQPYPADGTSVFNKHNKDQTEQQSSLR